MSNKVTYGEIIEALSQKTGFSKQKSEAFAKALVSKVKEELEETGKASITNFGSFKVKEVAERQGQNPQTGEPITIPAHKRVSFTPYKALREEVNAKFAHLETELLGEKEEGRDKDKDEETVEPATSPDEKQEEPEEKITETIFQFDDDPEDEIEEEKEVETSKEEPEEDDVPGEDPFAFDMPEQHKEESEHEPEPEIEPEPESEFEPEHETEAVSDEPFVREGKKENNNFALILIVAALLAIALVSVWWFFLRTEPTTMPAQQATVEQPRTSQPANNQTTGSVESNDPVQENVDDAEAQAPEQNEAPTTSASSATVQEEATALTDGPMSSAYTVKKNEWYWVIGKKVYGKSQFWPLIYQANFTMNTHPDSLADNTSLQIPALEGTATNPTKGDYLRLAEASQMVSDAYKKFGLSEKAGEYARFAKKWQRLGS